MHMLTTKPLRSIAAFLCGTALSVGAAFAEPVRGGAFNIYLNSDIGGFDHISTPRGGMSRYQVLYAVHDLLFDYDISTGKLQPRLGLTAKSMDDFKTWEVTLRPGVTFSNGEPMTTEAYVHHFKRLLESPVADSFRAELGSNLQEVVAIDDLTMQFKFAEPNVAFDVILGSPSYIWYLNAPGYAKEHENDEDYNSQAVGAGAFMLKEWQPGHSVTLVRNPNYWDAENVYADQFTFLISSGSETAIAWPKLLAGDVDAAMTFGELIPRGISGEGGLNFNEGIRQTLGYAINFNTDIAPFDDIRVRKAMAHALDREAMVSIVTHGSGRVANEGFEPESIWNCGNIQQPEYNPEKARELLAEYGKPVKIEFHTRSIAAYQQIAEIAQAMWREVGIEVEIAVEGSGPTALVSRVNRGELGSWLLVVGQNVHPTIFTTEMHSDRGENQWHLNTPEIDTAIDDIRKARSVEDIKTAHCHFEQVKADELPFLPLTYGLLSTFSQPDITGIAPAHSVLANFNYMRREK